MHASTAVPRVSVISLLNDQEGLIIYQRALGPPPYLSVIVAFLFAFAFTPSLALTVGRAFDPALHVGLLYSSVLSLYPKKSTDSRGSKDMRRGGGDFGRRVLKLLSD